LGKLLSRVNLRSIGRHDRKKVSRQTYLGGGADLLLPAGRVGPTGFAWRLDMTDEMLVLTEPNKAAAGAENVQVLEHCSPFRSRRPASHHPP
jgi:hypothetical protein